MSSRSEKWAHWSQVILVPVTVGAVLLTFYLTQRELNQTREANVTYQGTALCEAYREQVIDLHLLGYTVAEIRQTFLGEYSDEKQPTSEVNNVYDRFYVPECGSVEVMTKRLSRPAPLQESQQR